MRNIRGRYVWVKLKLFDYNIHSIVNATLIMKVHFGRTHNSLTLYDPGGGGALKASLRIFALTHLILELRYCALGTFPKKCLTPCGEKNNFGLRVKI